MAACALRAHKRPIPTPVRRPAASAPVPPEYDGEYCRGCGQIDDCDCDWLFGVETAPTEPEQPAFNGGPWCCDCHGPMGEDWSCRCRPNGTEATESA